ncbi:hypothetical protein L873DRAFT_131642 [Choiromyces venosus 120613-1]|uniref:Uncharacterized protein n=1 Tax=Choiromyces venosus 120613-1 TaxID=1336337 RepID=A0A3N4J3F6_9PEZI|nr:hypothetical protein L873DRAFT_131606 [Choiromyces venosus 120613-1]RPA92829.1 hypothetical protein L873DRAFT_131642 [Choiromyces venosus 120613-1]
MAQKGRFNIPIFNGHFVKCSYIRLFVCKSIITLKFLTRCLQHLSFFCLWLVFTFIYFFLGIASPLKIITPWLTLMLLPTKSM